MATAPSEAATSEAMFQLSEDEATSATPPREGPRSGSQDRVRASSAGSLQVAGGGVSVSWAGGSEEGEGDGYSAAAGGDGAVSGAMTPVSRAKSDIELSRKAVLVEEAEEDICSICLDEYTEEDPAMATHCGHEFHLQCVMQWAQRSRECPLCFHNLQLKDPDMNVLLPFGEYVSPAQAAAQAASLESWDLERLLVQLAAANQRHERRAAREARHRLRRGSGGEASAPQPIRGDGASARRHSVETVAPSSTSATAPLHYLGSGDLPGGASSGAGSPGGAYPASWPPSNSGRLAAAARDEGPSSSRGPHGPGLSPSLRAASASIKKGFAALKIRESFSKTTKEIKSLFSHGSGGAGPSSSGGSHRDRPSGGAAT